MARSSRHNYSTSSESFSTETSGTPDESGTVSNSSYGSSTTGTNSSSSSLEEAYDGCINYTCGLIGPFHSEEAVKAKPSLLSFAKKDPFTKKKSQYLSKFVKENDVTMPPVQLDRENANKLLQTGEGLGLKRRILKSMAEKRSIQRGKRSQEGYRNKERETREPSRRHHDGISRGLSRRGHNGVPRDSVRLHHEDMPRHSRRHHHGMPSDSSRSSRRHHDGLSRDSKRRDGETKERFPKRKDGLRRKDGDFRGKDEMSTSRKSRIKREKESQEKTGNLTRAVEDDTPRAGNTEPKKQAN